jgi:hypothetical protein
VQVWKGCESGVRSWLSPQKGQAHTQANKNTASQPVQDFRWTGMALEPVPQEAGEQGYDEVYRSTRGIKNGPQNDHLERNGAGSRTRKLRKKRQEEKGDLGIQHVGDNSLSEDAPEAHALS